VIPEPTMQGREPGVSCIVPLYNGAAYLCEAVESIWAQTYQPLEVIVVDDGSTDDIATATRQLGVRIRYVRQDNRGPAAARNHGVSLARGELIAFLDADDLWHPEKLARQAARFAERPELEISLTHFRNFWMPELAEEEKRFRDHPITRSKPGYTAQTLVARQRTFERIGGFDPKARHKDVIAWLLQARRAGAMIEVLPDVLVRRRIHTGNLSRQRNAEDAAELLALVKALLDQRRQEAVAP